MHLTFDEWAGKRLKLVRSSSCIVAQRRTPLATKPRVGHVLATGVLILFGWGPLVMSHTSETGKKPPPRCLLIISRRDSLDTYGMYRLWYQ